MERKLLHILPLTVMKNFNSLKTGWKSSIGKPKNIAILLLFDSYANVFAESG